VKQKCKVRLCLVPTHESWVCLTCQPCAFFIYRYLCSWTRKVLSRLFHLARRCHPKQSSAVYSHQKKRPEKARPGAPRATEVKSQDTQIRSRMSTRTAVVIAVAKRPTSPGGCLGVREKRSWQPAALTWA
jgi:hypothetical protein